MKRQVLAGLCSLAIACTSAVLMTSNWFRQTVKAGTYANGSIPIDGSYFIDENFRNKLLELPSGQDGIFTAEEIAALTKLDVSSSSITSLSGIENFTALKELNCSSNSITQLDLRANTNLVYLNCCFNELQVLNLTENKKLEKLYCRHANFYYDSAEDKKKRKIEILQITGLSSLRILSCAGNDISALDLSDKENLEELYCSDNKLGAISLQNSKKLTHLECENNLFSGELNLTGWKNLTYLDCSNNKLSSLDVSNCSSLKTVDCSRNEIATLKLSGATNLNDLNCYGNKLTYLDVSMCQKLTRLECHYNSIVGLNLSGVNDLDSLTCYSNQITKLDVSNKSALRLLDCSDNKITTLNVSGTPLLEKVECAINQISELDVTNHPVLKELQCYGNDMKILRIEGSTILLDLVNAGGQESTIIVGGGPNGPGVEYQVTYYWKSAISGITCDRTAYIITNNLTPIPEPPKPGPDEILINETNFPDENFRKYIVDSFFDKNNNGALDKTELSNVETIRVRAMKISSLEGLQYFTSLKELNCSVNNLTTLNVTCFSKLEHLDCDENKLTSLNLTKNPELIFLDCHTNQLPSLNINSNTKLRFLSCDENNFSKVSIAFCPDLVELVNTYPKKENAGIYYYEGGSGWFLRFGKKMTIVVDKPTPTPKPATQKSVEIGKSFQYEVFGVSSSSIKWSVGNTSVATVDSTGKVTGKSFGNTYLYAALPDGTTIKCLVKVVYPALRIRYTEKTLHINQTFGFTVSNDYGQKITWSVGNTSVATVDANGKVTGKSAANTYLYAKSADGRTAKCLVKVIDPGTLGINYTEKTVYLGQTFTFTAKNAGILKPTWSTGNTAVAKVDSNGKVTPVAVGNTYLYVKTEDGRSARCLVKVVDPGPLSITYTEKTIKVGATFQFTAKNPAGQTVSWRVGNTAVATVDANGKVTGKSAANTWLYASTPDGREVKCLLKIVA